jgi:hypothetical protein
MDPEKLLAAITELVDGMRADMVKHSEQMNAKYDAVMDAVKKKKDDDGDDLAQQTAADSVGRGELAVLAQAVSELQRKTNRPIDRDKLADEQSRCDAVLVAHGLRAEAPMSGEDAQSYKLRLHKPMQRHSQKWKAVDLRSLANDDRVIENVLAEIRADALQAGLNPVDLKPFEHRMITQTTRSHCS